MWGYPPWYGPPPPTGYGGSPNDKMVVIKRKDLLKLLRGNGTTKKKEKEEECFRRVPIRKPKTFTAVQMMLILTALFPIVGPTYYLGVIFSWSVLKAGMMALLGG